MPIQSPHRSAHSAAGARSVGRRERHAFGAIATCGILLAVSCIWEAPSWMIMSLSLAPAVAIFIGPRAYRITGIVLLGFILFRGYVEQRREERRFAPLSDGRLL